MNTNDPFELLSAVNPVPGLQEVLPSDEALLQSILASPVTPVTPAAHAKRRRRVTIGVVGGVSLVALSMAAFATLTRRSADDPTKVLCSSEASATPDARAVLVLSADPVEDCRQVWSSGTFGPVDAPPPLVACVNSAGVIVVVPGDVTTCERLEMVRWVMSFTDDEARVLAFTDEITTLFGTVCIDEADAHPTALAILAEYGLDDWTVETSGQYRPGRMCGAITVDPVLRTVFIGTRRGPP